MKRLSKKIWFCIFFILFFVTNISTINGLTKGGVTVSTAITRIVWSECDLNTPGEGYSYFNFTIDYSIQCPTFYKVTIATPYLCNFEANMTVDFENKNLDTYDYGWGYACMLGTIEIDPGITYQKTGYYIAINETGLTILPDGIYTVWIHLYHVPSVIYNETIVRIEEGIADIKYGSLPSVTAGFQFPSLILLGSFIISTLIVIRKRKK